MITLLDGPAAGTYIIPEGPYYLRAVGVPTLTGDYQSCDVLDKNTDRPKEHERVFIYRMTQWRGYGWMHTTRPKRAIPYVTADYEWLPDVDGEKLREYATFRVWWLDHIPDPEEQEKVRGGK